MVAYILTYLHFYFNYLRHKALKFEVQSWLDKCSGEIPSNLTLISGVRPAAIL